VPAAKAAWSRTTPLTSPALASFATVSATQIAAQTNAATAAGRRRNGCVGRRDRIWGRLLERSRCLRPFGDGVGVAPPPVRRKPGPQFFSMYAPAPSKRRHTPPRTPRHPRAVPATGARIAAAARPMRPRRDGRSSRRPSGIRRVLGSAAAGATTAWRAKLLGWGRQSHGSPRSVWPPANPAEHHDHRSGVGADHALVVALRRRAVRSCRIGERRVAARAAIRVQRATEHHPN
jgi:hypothetical protein